MLPEFEKRRQDLLAEISALEIESQKTAGAIKKKIDSAAWRLVGRLWLYRGTGPLAFMDHPGQIKGYLQYHEREAALDIQVGRDVVTNKELLDEIRLALNLLESAAPVPLF